MIRTRQFLTFLFILILNIFGETRSAKAYPVDISYSVSKSNSSTFDLVLSSNNCQMLVKQHQAICQWKKSLDPSFQVPPINSSLCKTENNSSINFLNLFLNSFSKMPTAFPLRNFSMTISDCLPDFVKAHFHQKLFHDGANCWGTVMGLHHLVNHPRFIWSEEVRYWYHETPFCRKLNPSEPLQPGDIINVYGPEYDFPKDLAHDAGYLFWQSLYPGRYTQTPIKNNYTGYHHLLHSEIYISPEITFGKESPEKIFRFDFHNMEEVYGRTNDPDCQENQRLSPHYREYQKPPQSIRGTKCDYFTNAFRCSNFKNFLGSLTLNSYEKQIYNEIKNRESMQKQIFQLTVEKGKTLSPELIQNILNSSLLDSQKALNSLKNHPQRKEEEMLLVLQYFSAKALAEGLSQSGLFF